MDIREALLELDVNFLVERFLVELNFNPESFINRMNSVVTLAKRGATEGERGASKEALKRMIDRAEEEAKAMAPDVASRFLAKIKAIAASVDDKQEPPQSSSSRQSRPPPPPQELPKGTWIIHPGPKIIGKIMMNAVSRGFPAYIVRTVNGDLHTLLASVVRRATQEEIDAALASRPQSSTEPPNSKSSSNDSNSSTNEWTLIRFAYFKEGTSDKVYGIARRGEKRYTFWGKRKGPYQIKDQSHLGTSELMAHYRKKLDKGYKETSDPIMQMDAMKILKQSMWQ